jgi:hypothetical protein
MHCIAWPVDSDFCFWCMGEVTCIITRSPHCLMRGIDAVRTLFIQSITMLSMVGTIPYDAQYAAIVTFKSWLHR